MTQDKAPEWAVKMAEGLPIQGDGFCDDSDIQTIALALSRVHDQAYERGQRNMRERAADARYVLVPEDPTAEMCSDAVRFALSVNICSEYTWPQYMHDLYKVMTAAAIRSLPIEQENK